MAKVENHHTRGETYSADLGYQRQMLIKSWSCEMASLGGNMVEGLFFIKIPRASGFRNINISVSLGIC